MNFLTRYRKIPLEKAVALARNDFVRSKETPPPRNRKPHRTARFYAVHFLYHKSVKSPGLIAPDMLDDLMRGYAASNPHTRMGIIKICQTARSPQGLLFLAYIRGGGFGSDAFFRKSANEAIEAINETSLIGIGESYRNWVELIGTGDQKARPPLMILDPGREMAKEIRRTRKAIRIKRT